MMKKLAILVISIAIVASIFIFMPKGEALTNSADTRLELEYFIREKIKNRVDTFEIVYKNHEVIDFSQKGVCSQIILDVLKQLPYEANNRKEVRCSVTKDGNTYILKYVMSYRTTINEERYINSYVEKESAKMLQITNNKQELVSLINKLVANKITYSQNGVSPYTAYGAVYDGKAVCHAYTLLATKFFNRLNIENRIVIGYLNKDNTKHSWNIVKIGDKWYHLDITFNDTIKPRIGIVSDYTLRSDAFMKKTRNWDYGSYPKAFVDLNTKVYEVVQIITEEKVYVGAETTQIVETPAVINTPKASETVVTTTPKTTVPTPKVETPVVVAPPTVAISNSNSYTELAKQNGLIPSSAINYSSFEVISREVLAEYIINLYEKLRGNISLNGTASFYDTNNYSVLKAKQLGIVNGISEGYYGPYYGAKKEEAAVMATNLAILFNVYTSGYNPYISDKNNISSWALSSVNFVTAKTIMPLKNNAFEPKNYLRKEEADEMIYKLYLNIK